MTEKTISVKPKEKKSLFEKIFSIVAVVLLAPVALFLVLVLLVFILGMAPFLTIAFLIYSYYGYRGDLQEKRLKLEYKLKTNKDLLTVEFKKEKLKNEGSI